MLDEEIMKRICPINSEAEERESLQAELIEEGFAITNYTKGSPFWFLVRLVSRIGIEIKSLARTIINSGTVLHAEGDWLEIKAADYGKLRKEAKKARGYVTIHREDYENALQIKKGHMFKTLPDVNGKELKFYVEETTVIGAGEAFGKVIVEAEEGGTEYNIDSGMIVVTMIHLDGITSVSNEDEWLLEEGTDQEELEALRSRCLGAWEEKAEGTTDGKIISKALEVNGVVNAQVDSQHPRGQGTTDIIITSTAGTATEELCNQVYENIKYMEGSYDNFLVKSIEIITQDVELTIYISKDISVDGVAEQAENIIKELLSVDREDANSFYLDNLRGKLWDGIPGYKRCNISQPVEDVELESGYILGCGNVSISVENL